MGAEGWALLHVNLLDVGVIFTKLLKVRIHDSDIACDELVVSALLATCKKCLLLSCLRRTGE